MNAALFLEAYQRAVLRLKKDLSEWDSLDEDTRDHYAEGFLELLIERARFERELPRCFDAGDANPSVGDTSLYAHALSLRRCDQALLTLKIPVREKMGIDVQDFLEPPSFTKSATPPSSDDPGPTSLAA